MFRITWARDGVVTICSAQSLLFCTVPRDACPHLPIAAGNETLLAALLDHPIAPRRIISSAGWIRAPLLRAGQGRWGGLQRFGNRARGSEIPGTGPQPGDDPHQ